MTAGQRQAQSTLMDHFFRKNVSPRSQTKSSLLLSKSNASIEKGNKMNAALSPQSKRPSSASPLSTRKKQSHSSHNTQLIIDAGQRDLGLYKCQKCGMEYWKGDPEDENLHTRHCKKHGNGLVIEMREERGESVVEEFEHGLDFGRIVLVHRGCCESSSYQKRKAIEVRSLVDRQLGFYKPITRDKQQATLYLSGHSGEEPSTVPDSDDNDEEQHGNTKLDGYHVYLYVLEDRVIGCLVAKRIGSAHRVVASKNAQNPEVEGLCFDTTSSVRAVCGVSRIWVHPDHRRHHIATRLLNACRKTLVYGYQVPLGEVAFSQPTTDGRHLAMTYCKTTEFLVFTE